MNELQFTFIFTFQPLFITWISFSASLSEIDTSRLSGLVFLPNDSVLHFRLSIDFIKGTISCLILSFSFSFSMKIRILFTRSAIWSKNETTSEKVMYNIHYYEKVRMVIKKSNQYLHRHFTFREKIWMHGNSLGFNFSKKIEPCMPKLFLGWNLFHIKNTHMLSSFNFLIATYFKDRPSNNSAVNLMISTLSSWQISLSNVTLWKKGLR